MSVKHNKDGGGNAEIKKELQEVKKETQEVKTAAKVPPPFLHCRSRHRSHRIARQKRTSFPTL